MGENDQSDILIKEGDQIIVKTQKVLKSFKLRKDRIIRVEKSRFRLTGAIGHPYGTTFEVKKSELVKVVEDQTSDQQFDIDTDKDNRNLRDADSNQKLKKEDLQELKKQGLTGTDIIDQLVENSATFKDKTEFAQAKYIKKKKKKWEARFTILKPSTRLVAQMYYVKGPARICNLRDDSLAALLTYSNVRAHSKVMLVESVAGLVLGAVLDRLGGFGKVVQFFSGSHPSREALECFGFPADIRQTMIAYPLAEVSKLNRNGSVETSSTPSNAEKTESQVDSSSTVIQSEVESTGTSSTTTTESNLSSSQPEASMDTTTNEDAKVSSVAEEDEAEEGGTEEGEASDGEAEGTGGGDSTQGKRRKQPLSEEERLVRRQRRQAESARARALLETRDMDALIVASKAQPAPLVLGLIDFLAPSRPFAVHCMYKEPLLDCYVQLRNRGGVVNLQFTETWQRNHQVLPSRTHPTIQMSGTGGYLLTGTTVSS